MATGPTPSLERPSGCDRPGAPWPSLDQPFGVSTSLTERPPSRYLPRLLLLFPPRPFWNLHKQVTASHCEFPTNHPVVGFSTWGQIPAGHLRIHVGQERHREGTGGVKVKAPSTHQLYGSGPLACQRPGFSQTTPQATRDPPG